MKQTRTKMFSKWKKEKKMKTKTLFGFFFTFLISFALWISTVAALVTTVVWNERKSSQKEVFSGFHLKKSLTINWVKTKVIFKNNFLCSTCWQKKVKLSKASNRQHLLIFHLFIYFLVLFHLFFGLLEN